LHLLLVLVAEAFLVVMCDHLDNAPNATVGLFCIGRMLYMLSVGDVKGGGPHLDGPWRPVVSGGMVVSKGGCVANGVLAN
jgi:hypothetical protein